MAVNPGSHIKSLIGYFSALPIGTAILWCYLIWYLVIVVCYFDDTPVIWLNSIGISAVVGFALKLSVRNPAANAGSHWQTFRLFFMPFAVSSFSSLIKGHGFVLIVPPTIKEFAIASGSCAGFIIVILILRWLSRE